MNNFHKTVIPITELIDLENNHVLPITNTGKCPFLNQDYSCNIYEDRPAICKKYGDESHPNMTCLYQTKEGNSRSHSSRKKIEKQQNLILNKYLKS